MAFSGIFGVTQNCVHKQGEPVNRVGVGIAAALDVIASVGAILLVVYGSKMGVSLRGTAQYLIGGAAALNLLMLFNANIPRVSESFNKS